MSIIVPWIGLARTVFDFKSVSQEKLTDFVHLLEITILKILPPELMLIDEESLACKLTLYVLEASIEGPSPDPVTSHLAGSTYANAKIKFKFFCSYKIYNYQILLNHIIKFLLPSIR